MNLIHRQGKMFRVNQEMLPESSRRSDILNALYYAMFKEFSGAYKSRKYKSLTNQQKMETVNQFAEDWLKERKYL